MTLSKYIFKKIFSEIIFIFGLSIIQILIENVFIFVLVGSFLQILPWFL